MNAKGNTARVQLDRLADALVEDILRMSDEEILEEFREDYSDPDQHEEELRKLFDNAVAIASKGEYNDERE